MKIFCLLFNHKIKSTSLDEWIRNRNNFYCIRCGRKFKRIGDIKRLKNKYEI